MVTKFVETTEKGMHDSRFKNNDYTNAILIFIKTI